MTSEKRNINIEFHPDGKCITLSEVVEGRTFSEAFKDGARYLDNAISEFKPKADFWKEVLSSTDKAKSFTSEEFEYCTLYARGGRLVEIIMDTGEELRTLEQCFELMPEDALQFVGISVTNSIDIDFSQDEISYSGFEYEIPTEFA